MTASEQPPVDAEPGQRPANDYERSDVNVCGVLGFAAGVAVTVAVVLAVGWQVIHSLQTSADRSDASLSSVVDRRGQPPAPRLQVAPRQHYQQFMKSQTSRLESYGWNDKRTVHIPVSRAMDLILERGLAADVGPHLGPKK